MAAAGLAATFFTMAFLTAFLAAWWGCNAMDEENHTFLGDLALVAFLATLALAGAAFLATLAFLGATCDAFKTLGNLGNKPSWGKPSWQRPSSRGRPSWEKP